MGRRKKLNKSLWVVLPILLQYKGRGEEKDQFFFDLSALLRWKMVYYRFDSFSIPTFFLVERKNVFLCIAVGFLLYAPKRPFSPIPFLEGKKSRGLSFEGS